MTKKSKPNVRKRQSSRLLKQVLSYNVEAAFKRINKGLKPAFQERPRNLDLITSVAAQCCIVHNSDMKHNDR